ncbi:MAG TPA: hypothetical protein VFV87_10160 [Pirellulaceae bacterium]|nr:hypothetical protein [Pirellulaceae bacterium]
MSSTKPAACLGFLTVVEHADLGLLGGYLLLNPAGRPLEFHCTAPLKANRTQEILYGPTLRPFLYGEQIGQTLLTRSKLRPLVVCTDSEPVLAAREFTHVPLVWVEPEDRGQRTEDRNRFSLARNLVTAAPHYSSDEAAIRESWPAQADTLDLLEPFARIREALDEAQKSARAAA